MQVHHIIPEKIIAAITNAVTQQELRTNDDFLIWLSVSEKEKRRFKVYHCGSHDAYTKQVLDLIGSGGVNRTLKFYKKLAEEIRNCINYHAANNEDPVSIDEIKVERMKSCDVGTSDSDSFHSSDSDIFDD